MSSIHRSGPSRARRECGCLAAGSFILLAAVLSAGTSLAAEAMPEMPKSLGGVGESVEGRFNGSYQTSIPIEVPAYHGIEPKMALQYESSQGNGWLGLGWSLSGLSQIERMSPGRGAPRVNGDDIFVLDGMELVPCATGSASPSCKTGGTHSARIENWQRIKFDASASQWVITAQNGTRAIYKTGFSVGGAQVRWMLTQVVDTHGNTVNYNYEADGSDWLYPASVTYNGTTIAFKREATLRNDPLRIGLGRGQGIVQYRLKTITVAVGGAYARGYKIGYGVEYTGAAATLGNVTYYGKDLVLDATGSITGGTRLPTRWFTYNPSGRGASSRFVNSRPATVGQYGNRSAGWTVRTLADVNGDGRQDAVWMFASKASNSGTRVAVARSNGDGTFAAMSYYMPVESGDYGAGGWDTQAMADVNGDGRQDAVWLYSSYPGSNNGVRVMVSLAQADGSFAEKTQIYNTPTAAGDYGARAWGWQAPKMADVNGDGCADAVWLYAASVSANLGTRVAVSKSQCNGYFGAMETYAPSSSGNYHPDNGWTSNGLADVNGDGRMDAYWLYSGRGDGARVAVALAEQNGSFGAGGFSYVAPVTSGSYGDTSVGWRAPQMADVNGDGKADAVWVYGSVSANNGIKVATSLSNGDGSFQAMAETTPWTSGNYGADWYTLNLADMNGDGQGDVALLYTDRNKGGTAAVICIAQENGTFPYRTGVSSRAWNTTSDAGASTGSGYGYNNAAAGWDTRLAGDIDGDGDADSVWIYSAVSADNGTEASVSLSSGGPALMTKDSTGTGATITMSYLPSSQWVSLNGAPVVHALNSVSVNPGGGQAVSTTTFGYWGSKYDRLGRRFLGFRYVNMVSPAATQGSDRLLTEMYFKQGDGAEGLLESRYRYSYGATTKLLEAQINGYAQNKVAPFVNQISEVSNFIYDPNDATKYNRTYMSYVYYADYGNPNLIYDYGDYALSGDEKTIEMGYAPANSAEYIVGLPAYSRTLEGIGTGGKMLEQTARCFDQPGIGVGACVWWKNPPTKGDLTQALEWADDEGSYWVGSEFGYDSYGNATSTKDAVGNVTYTTYDTTYHVYRIKTSNRAVDDNGKPIDLQNTVEWDYQCNMPLKQYGPNGSSQLTETVLDNLCRKTMVTEPGASLVSKYITKYWYCGISSTTNQCASTTGTNAQALFVDRPGTSAGDKAQWSSYYYDGLGRVLRSYTEGPGGDRSSIGNFFTYDERGQLSSESNPFYPGETAYFTKYSYDVLNRLSAVAYPNGKKRSLTYGIGRNWVDKSGSVRYGGFSSVVATDEMGRETVLGYDKAGRQVVESFLYKDVLRRTLQSYDVLGRKIGMQDANGSVWSYGYNSRGLVKSNQDPDRGTWLYAYYPDGKLKTQTDAKGQVTYYAYDEAGRKKQEVTLYGTSSAETTTWGYDSYSTAICPDGCSNGAGRVTRRTDANGSANFFYTPSGLVSGKRVYITGSRTASWMVPYYKESYSFGADLRLQFMTTSDYGTIRYAYDGAGRQSSVVFDYPYMTSKALVSSASYAADGSPESIAYGNGTESRFEYDESMKRVKRISLLNSAGGYLDDLQYGTRDDAGRLLKLSNPVAPVAGWTYAYDERGNLTTAINDSSSGESQSFDYDAVGNMTYNSRLGNYSYPIEYALRPHAPTKIGGMSFAYDANGSMVDRNGAPVVMNGRNLIASHGGLQFAYNGDGQRIKSSGLGSVRYFPFENFVDVGDTQDVDHLYVSAGGRAVSRITYRPRLECTQYSCLWKYDPTVFWLHGDHQNSTSVMTDANGATVARYLHRPYGQVMTQSGGSVADQRDFIGEERDAGTNLVYQRTRYYDAETGRYLSADGGDASDPMVGPSRFAYAVNDPINFVDDGGSRIPTKKGLTRDEFYKPAYWSGAGAGFVWTNVPVREAIVDAYWNVYQYDQFRSTVLSYDNYNEPSLREARSLAFAKTRWAFQSRDLGGVWDEMMSEVATSYSTNLDIAQGRLKLSPSDLRQIRKSMKSLEGMGIPLDAGADAGSEYALDYSNEGRSYLTQQSTQGVGGSPVNSSAPLDDGSDLLHYQFSNYGLASVVGRWRSRDEEAMTEFFTRHYEERGK